MRKYGIKALSLGDQRDIPYSYQARINDPKDLDFQAVGVPNVKFLITSPVADQADLGSCGAFAAVYNMVGTAVQNDEEPANLSQLFLYYAYRERYGDVNSDDGVMLRDLLKTLLEVGICLEETWPYTLDNWNVKPPPAAYEEAAQHKIKSYHALYTASDMIQCLASRYGFIGGIGCYEGFESPETERDGIVRLPEPGEKLLGWHAIFLAGYNLHKGVVNFENSYSNLWGNKGYGEIPITYLTNSHLAGDFFTIRS